MATRLLTLNRDEVMVLADRTLNADAGTVSMPIVVFRLLVKLGILYLDLVKPDSSSERREGTIAVTEAEAWHLRSKVTSGDKMAADAMFGIRLLRKLYAILIQFDADLDGLAAGEDEGKSMGAWEAEALKLWTKGQEQEDDLQTA